MANDANNPGTGDPAAAAATAAATPPAAPTVYELNDDAQVRFPGAKEPAKFGDWYRGVQQKITTSGQERSKLQKQLEARNAEYAQQQEDLKRLRAALGADPGQPKQRALAEGLKDLSYLDGRTGAEVVQALEQRLSQVDTTNQQYAQALKFMASKLAETMQATQAMSAKEAQAARLGRVRETMKALDMPDEAEEVALDLYHSFEGEELDEKFPELLKARWEQITGLVRALDQRKVAAARKQRFTAPKGGDARPGSNLDLSRASAKETADALWDLVKDPKAEA